MVEKKEYVFKRLETGGPLAANVWHKADGSDTAKPIAVYFHGGNFLVGNKDMFPPAYVDKLLELGFGAIVSPNYRLAPTISAFEGPVTDCKDAFIWAQSELPRLLASDAGVKLDGDKVVTLGHSAGGTLALLTAAAPKPPRAILDIFGMKYLEHEFYNDPNPALAKIPDFEQAFLDQIHKEIPPPVGAPPPVGPNGPAFDQVRPAFLFDSLKRGYFMKTIVPDGKFDRVDPSYLFSSSFPPTYFIHGGADTGVDPKFATRAHKELKSKGVETEVVIVEGAPHGFDAQAKPGDDKFEVVVNGFKFLRAHV